MHTVDLSPFDFTISKDAAGVETTAPYPIKDALINLLFASTTLKAREVLRRDDLATKILLAEGDALSLDDAEYAILQNVMDAAEGFGRHDITLIRRVLGNG